MHPAHAEARAKAEADGLSLIAWLDREATNLYPDLTRVAELAGTVHVVPEFIGNRSPFADPDARAVIAGIGLDTDIPSLISLYIAGLCGIGYGLRQLLNKLSQNGIALGMIIASGGAAQSSLVRQILADTTNLPVTVAETEEPVLLGTAMLGATAAGRYGSLQEAMRAMSRLSTLYRPAGGQVREIHDHRYLAFGRLQEVERQIRSSRRTASS